MQRNVYTRLGSDACYEVTPHNSTYTHCFFNLEILVIIVCLLDTKLMMTICSIVSNIIS